MYVGGKERQGVPGKDMSWAHSAHQIVRYCYRRGRHVENGDKLRQIAADGRNLSLRRADLTRKEPFLGSFHTILLTAILLCRLF